MPHPRTEGRQGADILCIQQLQPPGSIPGDRNAGSELHHRCAGNDRCDDVLQGTVAPSGCMERGGVRPGSIHGAAEQAGSALARDLQRRPGTVIHQTVCRTRQTI